MPRTDEKQWSWRERAGLPWGLALGALLLHACGDPCVDTEPTVRGHVSALTLAEREEVSGRIRAVVAERGITNALLFAGIASAETNMSQCWRDATWACQGPPSDDCDGGPVIAGAGDGPCDEQRGGLGMFQFDAGTYADTLAREGMRILSTDGNIEAAVDFVLAMVQRSDYVPGIFDEQDAIAWLNRVRPYDGDYTIWLQTVVRYYNGCVPGRCGAYDEKVEHYDAHLRARYEELGHEFWYPGGENEPSEPSIRLCAFDDLRPSE